MIQLHRASRAQTRFRRDVCATCTDPPLDPCRVAEQRAARIVLLLAIQDFRQCPSVLARFACLRQQFQAQVSRAPTVPVFGPRTTPLNRASPAEILVRAARADLLSSLQPEQQSPGPAASA